MDRLVWVRLQWNNYVELYTYSGFEIEENTTYIVETKHGKDFGRTLISPIPTNYPPEKEHPRIIKKASFEDIKMHDNLRKREAKSFKVAREKIAMHELPMKLINVYHFFDGNKVLFNFFSEGRVDFRNLVKDLASIFKTRIELHQVGVRDEAQMIGGFGVCGIQYCCQLIKTNKEPISIKMAKEQNLPLNAMKISGACGRLMCCLDFEFSAYKKQTTDLIQIGGIVFFDNVPFVIKEINDDKNEVTLVGEEDNYRIVSIDRLKNVKGELVYQHFDETKDTKAPDAHENTYSSGDTIPYKKSFEEIKDSSIDSNLNTKINPE